MAQPLRRISSSFSILFILYLGLSNLAFAELSFPECATRIADEYSGLYYGIRNSGSSDAMKWCPLWAAVCSYVYRNCPSAGKCEFKNYDPRITRSYNPGSSVSYSDFLSCRSCNVEVSVDAESLVPLGISIPKQRGPTPTDYPVPPGNGNTPITDIHQILAPGESPDDMLAESSSASSVTGAVTAVLVVGSIIGSVIAVKTTSISGAGFLGTGASGATPAIANPKTGTGSGQSVVDAVTLLLHFQSISASGLLSISYPALYRFFSYNFAWANLIIGSDAFKTAVRTIGSNPSCLRKLGNLDPALIADPHSASGMNVIGVRYDLDSATIGGLVYLSAIIGVAVALTVFVLGSVVLRILNAISKSTKLQAQVEIWPSKASSMSLRLFVWVLGSICTFAIYQFADPCSSASLIAFASVEFILIILTLLLVSIFIIKIANAQGPEVLFQLSESEESKYSRKWGSLYGLLKPDFYWFFIPDYVWTFAKSMIIGLGQGSGISQVCALTGLEVAILLALLIKRPYATSSANAFHIFSTCKRLVASASLLVFWDGFSVQTDTKRTIGIILMVVESAYAAALFVILLLHSGAKFVKWNTERKERRRASDSGAMATTSSLAPQMLHTTSDYSSTSPGYEKTY